MFRKMLLFLYKHLAVLCWLLQPHRYSVCCFYWNFPWRCKLKWKPHKIPAVPTSHCCGILLLKSSLRLCWILFLQGQKNTQVWNAAEEVGADLWGWECSTANTSWWGGQGWAPLRGQPGGTQGSLGLVWDTLMQTHLWGMCLAGFREEICSWERQSWKYGTCSNEFPADTGLTCQQQHYRATLFYKILRLQECLFPGCGRFSSFKNIFPGCGRWMLFVLVMPVFAAGLFRSTCWIDFNFC